MIYFVVRSNFFQEKLVKVMKLLKKKQIFKTPLETNQEFSILFQVCNKLNQVNLPEIYNF